MTYSICTTCGTQFASSPTHPAACSICNDARQYLRPSGQQWTTLPQLIKSHRHTLRQEEPGLLGLGMEPSFAIGQRALLVQSEAGNVLWDCIPLIDPGLVSLLQATGGLQAIAISHPHYYATMVEWSRAFGDVPIYIHHADRQWVQRSDGNIQFWDGPQHRLASDLTLIHCGGHFAGGAGLHWSAGANHRGALLTGDILQVTADRQHVSFMYSYPNFIPLNAAAVQSIVAAVTPFEFERIYGAFWDLTIPSNATQAVQVSADRYLRAIGSSQSL